MAVVQALDPAGVQSPDLLDPLGQRAGQEAGVEVGHQTVRQAVVVALPVVALPVVAQPVLAQPVVAQPVVAQPVPAQLHQLAGGVQADGQEAQAAADREALSVLLSDHKISVQKSNRLARKRRRIT